MNKHPPHCYQHFTSSNEDQQDVLQLDVAMDDALAVQVAQPHQEAHGDLLLQLEALLASKDVAEIGSRVEVRQQAETILCKKRMIGWFLDPMNCHHLQSHLLVQDDVADQDHFAEGLLAKGGWGQLVVAVQTGKVIF